MKILKLYSATILAVIMLGSLSCQKDNCDESSCLNGGVCVNGDCDCPEGYEGPACADQVTPSRVIINSITVTRFPGIQQGSGIGWDQLDGPDIFWRIAVPDEVLFTSPVFFENAVADEDYTFTNTGIVLTDVTTYYFLNLLDDDTGLSESDYMGGVTFWPYDSLNRFPATMNLDFPWEDVSFTLTLGYEW